MHPEAFFHYTNNLGISLSLGVKETFFCGLRCFGGTRPKVTCRGAYIEPKDRGTSILSWQYLLYDRLTSACFRRFFKRLKERKISSPNLLLSIGKLNTYCTNIAWWPQFTLGTHIFIIEQLYCIWWSAPAVVIEPLHWKGVLLKSSFQLQIELFIQIEILPGA